MYLGSDLVFLYLRGFYFWSGILIAPSQENEFQHLKKEISSKTIKLGIHQFVWNSNIHECANFWLISTMFAMLLAIS
jgi:hypothetical protein